METGKILLFFIGLATSNSVYGCYTNYQNCYSTFTQVSAPTTPDADWTNYCNAVNTLETCFKNDAMGCSPGSAAPQQYTTYLTVVEAGKKSCLVAECTKKQLKCSQDYQSAYGNLPNGSAPNSDQLALFCPSMNQVISCYEDIIATCSDEMTAGLNDTIASTKMIIGSYCGGGSGLNSCMMKSLQCMNTSSSVAPQFTNFDPSDLNSVMQLLPVICPLIKSTKDCFQGLFTECPEMRENSQLVLQSFSMIDSYCSQSDCFSKAAECLRPIMSSPQCLNNSAIEKLTLSEGVDCCRQGDEALTCLRNGGCSSIVNSNPELAQIEQSCRGYKDYCPGMFECYEQIGLSGLNSPQSVCMNVGTLLDCVNTKCAGKPQIGRGSLTSIKEMYTKLCGVVGKYPAVIGCTGFTSCIEKAPSLPGTVASIESTVSVRDTDRWCKIAKAFVNCGEGAPQDNTCSLPNTYSADVADVKKTTEEKCSGIRSPCLPVFNCLATLQGDQAQILLKTTCPNIPAFVTCTESSLNTCGVSSRVKAEYSLKDIEALFIKTCQALTTKLHNCKQVNQCLNNVQLPTIPGDMIDKFSDQTYWCGILNKITGCIGQMQPVCGEAKSVHDKFMNIYHEVSKHCPAPGYKAPVTDDDNGTSALAVNGLVFAVGAVIIHLF